MAQPIAKVRSRKDGSAVPLDELDKQLLNLLQGSFPIASRPYAHVADLAGVPEEEVLTRTKRLLDERIIREVTPIFDTRVLGYSSMLVAAKVDPENPWRAAKIINSHPGCRTTTCATTTSTSGSRSPPSPARRSASRARWSCCSASRAPSRCASCPRCGSSRSGWTSRWRRAPRRWRPRRRPSTTGSRRRSSCRTSTSP